jgi:hypothetical protein
MVPLASMKKLLKTLHSLVCGSVYVVDVRALMLSPLMYPVVWLVEYPWVV